MTTSNLTELDRISELAEQINKIFEKNISYWKQFLKKNNLSGKHTEDGVRKLVRHAKAMNNNLRIEIDALNSFLQLIELEVKWATGEIADDLTEDTPASKLRIELLCAKNRAIKSIKDINLLFEKW